MPPDLGFAKLRAGYASGGFRPTDVLEECLVRVTARGDDGVWITVLDRDRVMRYALDLEAKASRESAVQQRWPLYGIPFAIKDSIDLAGVPTTVACPEYAYVPGSSAPAVQRLIDAGAIPVGKTNLDQFATGLVGVRSPYGVCRNPYNDGYIAGGSSSGSAVAVAAGLVGFALATDAAGSGRVPAALCNLVGVKPSSGLISKRGVVPACRSVDCVSVLAARTTDAYDVARAAAGHDPADPYSRAMPPLPPLESGIGEFVFATPAERQREFFGDEDSRALFETAVRRLVSMGGTERPIDIDPMLEAGQLLYSGPWIADRLAGLGDFVDLHPEAIHPVTRTILERGGDCTGTDVFAGLHRLRELKRAAETRMAVVDVLVVPTVPTVYSIDEVLAQPFELNERLGYYTTFVNLLDMAAVAVPSGWRRDGLPSGVTLVGPHGTDASLVRIAAEFEQVSIAEAERLPVVHPASS